MNNAKSDLLNFEDRPDVADIGVAGRSGEHPRLFPLNDNISAVADVSRCFERPDRECLALKCWHGDRYVLGRFFPGTVPEFASDAAAPIDAFNGQHRLRKRRPMNFGKVMILPLTGWIRSF